MIAPVTDELSEITDGYVPGGQNRPIGSYLVLAGGLATLLGAGLWTANQRGRRLDDIRAADIVLASLAIAKLSRLTSKDRVTAFLRAPFTRFQESSGHGEVEETPRGSGLQLAVGELLVCPYCIAQWFAAAWLVGILHAPRATRGLSAMWAAYALADLGQLGYAAAEKRA